MGKEYVLNSIKHNKAASITIAAAALISSTLLSLLGVLFYNFWIDDKQNSSYTNASLLGTIYSLILLLAAVTLILIIHNAFTAAMNNKIHQLGLFQSAGATPRQIRMVLLYEALFLSTAPVITGTVAGVALSYGVIRYLQSMAEQIVLKRDTEIVFQMDPLVIAGILLITFLTIYISAWIPARRLSKISPIEAIRSGAEPEIKKIRKYRLLSGVFGIEGELTVKSLYVRRRAFRMSSISLLLALVIFSAFMNTDTLSSLSTKRTYFEKLPVEERAEALENDQQIRSVYRLTITGMCGLVALIGMANVFANALGGVAQRKREFARYISIGMTPGGVRKMLLLEALLIFLKPLGISIVLNIVYVAWGMRRASIPLGDYLRNMPLVPVMLFAFVIIALIGTAYLIGSSQIIRLNTAASLKDETLF